MEKAAFEILKNIENTWWHYGRTQAVEVALKVVRASYGKDVLDVGAGYGGMYPLLSQYGDVDAIEPNLQAAEICKQRGYIDFFSSEIDAVKQGKLYDILGAFDVIEHVDDDKTFVSNLNIITKKGGLLVATVPAFSFLWGEHDVHHMHFRRHTIKSMKKLLHNAGYDVVYARYWNVFLFPFAVCTRLFGKSGDSALHPHPLIALILKLLVWFEARVIRFLPAPFGLSVVIVGRKK